MLLSVLSSCSSDTDNGNETTPGSVANTSEQTLGESANETPGESATETPGASATETPGESVTEIPDESVTEIPGESATETPGESVTETPGASSSETSPETDPVDTALLNIDAKYAIIRPETCSDEIKNAAIELKNTLATVTGGSITLKEDFLYGDNQPDQYEILIGQTNRDESAKALEAIKYNDYTVEVSGDKLVITAYTDEKLLEAMEYVKGLFANASGSVAIKAEDLKTFKAEYKFDQIKFGDIDLAGYSIIIPQKANDVIKSYADKLQAKILENGGILLPIKTDSKEETEKEILLGNTSRAASKAVKQAALPINGYSITSKGSKIVIKAKDDAFAFVKTLNNIITELDSGAFSAGEGKITMNKEPIFTTFTFTDVHNNFAMLEPTNNYKDYIVRKNVKGMIDHLIATEGKVDMVMVGGDLISDYHSWQQSGKWPYGYFVEYRQRLVEAFSELAKDGKCVTFVAGNHDYAQGEDAVNSIAANGYATTAPHTSTGNYNSADFYFGDAGMRQNIGELPESEMFWKIGEKTGDKYLLAYHYVMNGIHVMGLAPDPDHSNVWSKQGEGYSEECLEWLDKKLDEIDPYGTEIIFMNCHYVLGQPLEAEDGKISYGAGSVTREKLVPIYKGHHNLFHFYGHHPVYYHDYSVRGVLHHNAAGEAIAMKGTETSSLEVMGEIKRSFTSVNMGHFRPDNNQKTWFYMDKVTGYAGTDSYGFSYITTCTPRVAQGMYVKVYEDKIVFQTKNYGDIAEYRTEDVFEPYTVWLYK